MGAKVKGKFIGGATIALCLVVAICAWQVAARRDGDASAPPSPETMHALDSAQRAFAGARESSPDSFLRDLDTARKADAVHAVTWVERTDLPEAAADALEAYRSQTTASVVASGYLDLKGNAWCALVSDATFGVDVLYVTTDEAATSSRVRVVRLAPCKGEGSDE